MTLLLRWFWLVFLMHLKSLTEVEAQFPRDCTTPEALQSRICCPLWEGSMCGLRSGRGFCSPTPEKRLPIPVDYRVDWPHFFYDRVCICHGNYDGFDCSQCLPGWKGPRCQEPHILLRKEITDLTDSERETFLSNLHQAKHSVSTRYKILTSDNTSVGGNFEFHNASVYDLYIWMHYYSSKSYAGSEANAAHRGPAFPFWHRVFLLFIEREIRDLTGNQDFYIPYWDWTRTDHCNICTNEYFGGVGENGHIDSESPFSRWKTICPFPEGLGIICAYSEDSDPTYLSRNPGKDPLYTTLPTAEDVEKIMTTALYDTPPFDRTSRNSFRNQLEGFEILNPNLNDALHNQVHRYLNGTISLVATAANDPIFMLHHSFIDMLFERWLQQHRNVTYPDSDQVYPAQRAQANMSPFFPLRTNDYYRSLDTETLGYSYKEHSLCGVGNCTTRQAAGFLEESTASGVQWQWPVLGVCSIALICVSVGAAIKCKGKIQQTQDTKTQEEQMESDYRSNSLYTVWIEENRFPSEGRRDNVETTVNVDL